MQNIVKIVSIIAVTLFVSLANGCGNFGFPDSNSGGGSSTTSSRDNQNGGGTTSGTPGSVQGADIQFNLSDAVAILKVPESSLSKSFSSKAGTTTINSNIFKLKSDGKTEDVFTSKEAIRASETYIAPDGKLYLVFSTAVMLNNKPCVLLRLGRDNTSECVDNNLKNIIPFKDPIQPVQFDGTGNIFYAGQSSDGKGVLRKKSPSLADSTDLTNDNITLSSFLVKEDGTVYIAGQSSSTNTNFFRRISTTGALENLLNGADIKSLYKLPDGNVYAGDWGKKYGVMKVTSKGIEDKLYIGFTSMNGIIYDADFFIDNNSYNACNVGIRLKYDGFCGSAGTDLSYIFRTSDDRVYAVIGTGDRSSLWQYWPAVQPVETSILRPTIASGTLTSLLIAGYDSSNKNKLIAYNTSNASETDLLGGTDIEIYHFSYSAKSGRILFDGLRFSDNKYLVGSIDTQNGNTLTVLQSGIHYEDLQFFE